VAERHFDTKITVDEDRSASATHGVDCYKNQIALEIPRCPVCGDNPSITQLIDYNEFCGVRGEETPPAKRLSPLPSGSGEISPEELKQRLDRGEKVFILDVRNPPEYDICRIPGSVLIPLPDLPVRTRELDADQEIVVHCKSGMRSAKAIGFLREQGFHKLRNLTGGILAWAQKVDPTMPTY
jgi:sulfur-carrier protein adenylyltransferase/sulfurtransferase